MRTTILELEKKARLLDPPPQMRNEWNTAVQAYADDFLKDIETAKGYTTSEGQGKGVLELNFDQPKPLDQLLEVLKKEVDDQGINAAAGSHLGYIPGGGIYPTAMGDYLAAITNRYVGMFFASPGGVRMENQLIRWMNDLVGYPSNALGNLTSGGSIANLIAIVSARDAKGITSKKVDKAVIYLTEQVHHCVQKAIRIAGLSEATIRYIPMDERFRMDADFLEVQARIDAKNGLIPFMVVGSAGTTDVGAIDPLNRIADVAEEHDMWYHVDAAYGGFFLLADAQNQEGQAIQKSFEGIERSDSVAIDPHKGLFLAYGVGAVLIKNVKAMMDAHFYRANYMQDATDFNPSDEPNPADLSPELTKHFRGLRMWLPLHLFGIEPFKAALTEKIMLCRYFYEEVQKLGFEVGPYPELSVAVYRYVPTTTANANAFNEALLGHLQRDGRIFVSSTNIKGAFWIRIAILSFRTHLQHIDLFLEMLKEGVAHLQEK